MSKIHSERYNKFFKRFGITGAVLTIAIAVGLVVMLVLDVAELNYFVTDGPRTYVAYFISEDNEISYTVYTRGAVITVPSSPTHSPKKDYIYTFKGWDITGDNVPDILPHRAYYSFTAVAVYSSKYTGKRIRSTRPTSSKSSSSSKGKSN